MANNNGNEVTGWAGWVSFSGFLLIVMGILEMISGLTALLNDKFYVASGTTLVTFDITTWGWIHLLLGLIVMMAGMAVLSGHVWGRVVAIFLAMLSIIANFGFIKAYPFWSIIAITIDVLIIYALTVHGREGREV